MRLDKPYSVLYAVNGEIYRVGPFVDYEKAIAYLKSNDEVDIEEQYVYVMTPDHRLLQVYSEDLEDATNDGD